MRIAIRVDAAIWMGTGHVMRCATLARALIAQGCEVLFVCRTLPGDCCDWLESNGFSVCRLSRCDGLFTDTDPDALAYSSWLGISLSRDAEESAGALADHGPFDWLVVDHYALDAKWEHVMRSYASHILAIDDLADRLHDCDLLLDQNYYKNSKSRYDRLTPRNCRRLLGQEYALLRPEFWASPMRSPAVERDGTVNRVLVFLGGTDPGNLTELVLHALVRINRPDILVDVVIGEKNPHRERLVFFVGNSPQMKLHVQVNNLAELITNCDLGIGAGGSTTWERCLLGLPTLTIVLEKNQLRSTLDLAEVGAIYFGGEAGSLTIESLAEKIGFAIAHPEKNLAMAEKSKGLMQAFANYKVLPVVSEVINLSS